MTARRYQCVLFSWRSGTDINLEQLRVGMTWWYREDAMEQSAEDRASYAAADEARARRVGLWKDAKPVPPR